MSHAGHAHSAAGARLTGLRGTRSTMSRLTVKDTSVFPEYQVRRAGCDLSVLSTQTRPRAVRSFSRAVKCIHAPDAGLSPPDPIYVTDGQLRCVGYTSLSVGPTGGEASIATII